MKKTLVFLLALYLSITLIACYNQPTLAKPEGLSYNNGLVWNEVENADDYLIVVNGEEIIREVPYIAFIQEGTYVIKIFARASDFKDSLPAEITITIDYDQDAEIVLEKEGNLVSWNEVEFATHYFIIINTDIIRVEDLYYDISSYQSLDYSIFVYAVFPDGSKTINSNTISK